MCSVCECVCVRTYTANTHIHSNTLSTRPIDAGAHLKLRCLNDARACAKRTRARSRVCALVVWMGVCGGGDGSPVARVRLATLGTHCANARSRPATAPDARYPWPIEFMPEVGPPVCDALPGGTSAMCHTNL